MAHVKIPLERGAPYPWGKGDVAALSYHDVLYYNRSNGLPDLHNNLFYNDPGMVVVGDHPMGVDNRLLHAHPLGVGEVGVGGVGNYFDSPGVVGWDQILAFWVRSKYLSQTEKTK